MVIAHNAAPSIQFVVHKKHYIICAQANTRSERPAQCTSSICSNFRDGIFEASLILPFAAKLDYKWNQNHYFAITAGPFGPFPLLHPNKLADECTLYSVVVVFTVRSNSFYPTMSIQRFFDCNVHQQQHYQQQQPFAKLVYCEIRI